MPRGDGTGPIGQGQGRGMGRGRMSGDKAGAGPGGGCVCTNPNCDGRVAHQPGQPCNQISCPKCGADMTRE
jgi:hypothetical protein